MPKIDPNADMATAGIPGLQGFSYSAPHVDRLTATSYTLVTIAVDISASVRQFRDELVATLKKGVDGCRLSPMAHNILVRVVTFNQLVEEVHGFLPLDSIDDTLYDRIDPHGTTALFDAAASTIGATAAYAKTLFDQDFDANGVTIIITDGEDNSSKNDSGVVGTMVDQLLHQEQIGAFTTILVGVNAISSKAYLEAFRQKSRINQYVDVGDATPRNMAKLAEFISRSASSTAQGQAVTP